jgi:hypothetical protein
LVAGSNANANARMNWVREMAASVENDANRSVRVREVTRTGLEILARAFGISIARRDHPNSWSFDDLQGKLQRLEESAGRLRKVYGLNQELLSRPSNIEYSGELISTLDEFCEALDKLILVDASVKLSLVRQSRDGGAVVEVTPSDCAGNDATGFDEELAERLLSESMDRLAVIARNVSDLAAETAIDLAMIETKRVQIDRAQAENWALLRELTGWAQ